MCLKHKFRIGNSAHIDYISQTHHWREQAEPHAYSRTQPDWSDFCSELKKTKKDGIMECCLVQQHACTYPMSTSPPLKDSKIYELQITDLSS